MNGESLKLLEARVAKLEADYKARQSANTVPLAFDQAMSGRGFLKESDFVSGQTTFGVSGVAHLFIPGLSVGNIAFAQFADGSGYCEAIVTDLGNGLELRIDGIFTEIAYFVVFLKTNVLKAI